MNYILFDEPSARTNLLPLTYTRPIADLRIGIFKIIEKWERYLKGEHSFLTESYLQQKFTTTYADVNIYINSTLLPSDELITIIEKLDSETGLLYNGKVAVIKTAKKFKSASEIKIANIELTSLEATTTIQYPWDIFLHNGAEIKRDFELIKRRALSENLEDPHTKTYNPKNIFIEKGAKIKAAILDADNGPIYIGKDAQVMPGSIITGPFALCEGAVVNPGGKMRGDTTIGPYSKVGGEISNSVIWGYSNKGHEGFIGNTVIGEWCNLGADTNCSNLKNDYGSVKVWNYQEKGLINTERQFCGLIMGDHSKAGINTMFNTGTVVGVNANVFGAGFPEKFIPSFSWGGAEGSTTYKIEKALQVAQKVMERRGMSLNKVEQSILEHIFNTTKEFRD